MIKSKNLKRKLLVATAILCFVAATFYGSMYASGTTVTLINSPIGFIVQSGGSGYTTPHATLTGGGGSGATAVVRVSQGVIIGVTLTVAGSGYTSAPSISIRDPSPRAHGVVITPTFNLATIPSDWWNGNYGAGVQITHLDYSVEHTSGSPSIRIDAHTSEDINTGRELDSNWFAVKPGDHVVFSAWIKTEHSTLGLDNVAGYGALIGFDCYGDTGIMFEWDGLSNNQPGNTPVLYDPIYWCPYGPNSHSNGLYVPWNSDWTYKVIDCYIPDTVPDYYHTTDLFNGGTPTQRPVTGIIPWILAATHIEPPNNSQDQGIVWIADAQLYITP